MTSTEAVYTVGGISGDDSDVDKLFFQEAVGGCAGGGCGGSFSGVSNGRWQRRSVLVNGFE